MKFKFIGNAGGIFTGSNGTRILCDPWIVDGVFEDAWYHYPPLKTKLSDIKDVDGIYVSHIHPDHYDERTFNFPKDIPIIILNAYISFVIYIVLLLSFTLCIYNFFEKPLNNLRPKYVK